MGKKYARYVSAACVFPIKKTGNKTMILLQKRANTGFADGYWEAGAAGHVDDGECMGEAMVHEAKEELGIIIKETDLQFIYFANKANYVKNPRPGEESA
jgi:8-oxo-dGTP pyrophosphatase MutT (NUDIX family)